VIDHLTVKVTDYARSKPFYAGALAPLGYVPQMEFPSGAGFGVPGKPDLWIVQDRENVRPMHFAFHTRDRKVVDAFFAAALAAGGRDNGGPGIRKDYHPNYYAAFVHDPDGHNVEVVCHEPPAASRAGRRAKAGRAPAGPKPARKAGGRKAAGKGKRR
jgi:catechol 2,3-dioxygenase-like lactoylglutathione lyase family enzyme